MASLLYRQVEAQPTPSPVPRRQGPSDAAISTSPIPRRPVYPTPRLRIIVNDLSHRGAALFLNHFPASTILAFAKETVLDILYPSGGADGHGSPSASSASAEQAPWKEVRSVTLVLDDMPGVAYTTGISLDEAHKEIHLSMSYIEQAYKSAHPADPTGDDDGTGNPLKPGKETLASFQHEIKGVLVHEMVHCWQRDGHGTAPGGLVEGVADFVRLRAGLGARHWGAGPGRDGESGDISYDWDAGYERTAWFLDWLERDRVGHGFVTRLNSELGRGKYEEDDFWTKLCNARVTRLFDEYKHWAGG